MFADRYELGEVLGRGGMAEVVEGVAHGAHGFTRRVAIKKLLPAVRGDDHLVRMFLDEARIASHLHHAGIVAVLDYGVVDGAPFQVLELVEGWNAAQLFRMVRARGKGVPVEIALHLATEVAHALAYAHERKDERGAPLGIVHRDVKPSNILVSKSGGVKLGDFGIAFARERGAVTTGFVVRGTPGYMSPEQLFGGIVGPASDIFSLGITLHALLTGRTPIDEEGRRSLASGLEIELSPDLPLDATTIIRRAVRLRPEERHTSARELAHALGEALAPRLETDITTHITAWLTDLQAPPPRVGGATTAILVPTTVPKEYALRLPTNTIPDRPPLAIADEPPGPPLPRLASRSSPPTHRRAAIFMLAILISLVVGASGLLALLVLRPSALRSPPLPSAPSASPTASTSIPSPPVPEDSDATSPVPSIPGDAGHVAKPPSAAVKDYEFIVGGAIMSNAGLRYFDVTPDEGKRLQASMEATVRACAAGQRACRGTVIGAVPLVMPNGLVQSVSVSRTCVGRFCARPPTDTPWISTQVLDCVTAGFRRLRLPPLAPGSNANGLHVAFDFTLR